MPSRHPVALRPKSRRLPVCATYRREYKDAPEAHGHRSWCALAAAVAVLIASLRIAATYRVFNHTIHEPDHLEAEMEWLDAGKYLYANDHTPLARVFGVLLP